MKNHNILITGAEQGLGAEIQKQLENKDSEETAIFNISGIMLQGSQAWEVANSVDAILNLCGRIDVVINNYGINHLSWIGETPASDRDILLVNVMMPYWIINALMAREQRCTVINIGSQAGRIPQRCSTLYCASKAAMIHMTRCMARELAPKGWVINCLCPGKIVDTKMSHLTDQQVMKLRGWPAEEMDRYALSLIPMGRFTDTEEVASMVLRMLEWPDYINGAVIDMMGGQ